MRTLLIGAHTGGIGDEFVEQWIERDKGKLGNSLSVPQMDLLDVTDDDSIEAYLRMSGPYDYIVYSAGVNRLRGVQGLTPRLLSSTFAVNTFGLPLLMSAHTRLFPQAEGRVVQIISDAAHTPMRHSLAYCASKAGAEMALRVLARELYPRWVVVGVNPGVIADTDMTEDVDSQVEAMRDWSAEKRQAYEDKSSILGRRVYKHEVANLMHYALSGPEALNGSIITINGGK